MIIDLEVPNWRGYIAASITCGTHENIPLGKSCLVIGGGGVAIDCAQHAVRQGAERVMIACLESWETMPASRSEKEDAQEEGITFYPSLARSGSSAQEGRVTGVEFLESEFGLRRRGEIQSHLRPGTVQRVLEADTVILAVGQSSTLPSLSGMEGLEMTSAGLIRAGEDMSTNLPGVFAGGDVRWRFARNATDAIADGQRAARSIHGYLSGRTLRISKKGFMKPVAPDFENTRCETIAPVQIPKEPPAKGSGPRGDHPWL